VFRPYLNTIGRHKRILEIGPLANPMVPKAEDMDVFYADIRSIEEIKDFYKNDNSVDKNKIVDIDYVIKDTYSGSLKNVKQFDYVIMSHVIEHIPRIIDFFFDISNILKSSGKLCLTIPDKRYCFDHYRCPTSFAECYDIYRRGVTNNPLRVLDHCVSWTINDPVFWWGNPSDYENIPKDDARFAEALSNYDSALTGNYHDVHFNVFTPETFLLLIYNLTKSFLFPFEIVEFYGTDKDTFEFNVVLKNRLLAPPKEGSKSFQEDRIRACDQLLVLLKNNSDLEELNRLKYELEMANEKIQYLQQRLEDVFLSRSWRITGPLRSFSKFIMGNKK
jgi:SAM-dependent methyltransferase